MTPTIDVLMPTHRRPASLAVTLSTLAFRRHQAFRIIVSDQTLAGPPPAE